MTEKKIIPPTGGGSKGGKRFPRLELNKAHEYAKKLVSKTHTGPQPANIILPGVFGTAGPAGQVRASALKQYGLLDGNAREYAASNSAKQLNSSTPEDLPLCLQHVFLAPPLFKTLFDTFLDDGVSRAKIRQQASNLGVHPDSLDECVDIFVTSANYAGLANESGENIIFHSTPQPNNTEELVSEDEQVITYDDEGDKTAAPSITNTAGQPKITPPSQSKANIDIKIDPSMDPEKLEKHLSALRKYGLI